MAKATKRDAAVKEQAPNDLQAQLTQKQADLLGYKKGLAAGELKNTGVIKTTRKEIARIKTALRVEALGKEGEK